MVSAALMCHPSRRAFVDELAEQLPEAEVIWDRHGDRWETGARALGAFDPEATHHLVVQDDAVICRDLIAGAERVGRAAGERPVALYAGRPRPQQARVAAAVTRARQAGRHFFVMPGPLWGVALLVPTAHIPELVRWGNRNTRETNYDLRIAAWYRRRRISCLYTVPSLVDHREVHENPSLIEGRTGNRTAYLFIGAESSALDIDWGSATSAPTRPPRPKGRSMPRIADRRIYGYDRHGRHVLIAAPGQPIPDSIDVAPEPTAGPLTADKPKPKRAAKKAGAKKGKAKA